MLKSLYSRHRHVFLEMLRTRRAARRLRQRDVAHLLGRGQATVSRIEAGTRRLDVIELRAWLGVLGVDFLDFMSELERRLLEHAAIDARLSSLQRTAERHGEFTVRGRTRQQ